MAFDLVCPAGAANGANEHPVPQHLSTVCKPLPDKPKITPIIGKAADPLLHTYVAWAATLALVAVWYAHTTWEIRIRSVFTAAMFSVVECVFTACFDPPTRQWPPQCLINLSKYKSRFPLNVIAQTICDATSYFSPIRTVLRCGHTTFDMFWMNVLWCPIGTELYFNCITFPCQYRTFFARMLLFAFNVWITEVVMGTFLLYAWGRRAWHYTEKWSRINGFITLDYFHYWSGLGIYHILTYSVLYVPVSKGITDYFVTPCTQMLPDISEISDTVMSLIFV